MLNIAGYGRL